MDTQGSRNRGEVWADGHAEGDVDYGQMMICTECFESMAVASEEKGGWRTRLKSISVL